MRSGAPLFGPGAVFAGFRQSAGDWAPNPRRAWSGKPQMPPTAGDRPRSRLAPASAIDPTKGAAWRERRRRLRPARPAVGSRPASSCDEIDLERALARLFVDQPDRVCLGFRLNSLCLRIRLGRVHSLLRGKATRFLFRFLSSCAHLIFRIRHQWSGVVANRFK